MIQNRFCLASLLSASLFFASFGVSSRSNADDGLERVPYNNPELVVDLAVGLWSWPVPTDVNGDGLTDLIISCEDQPYNGTYYFENSGKDVERPIFKPAKRLSKGVINVQPSYINGELRVLTPGKEYPDFVRSGVDKPVAIPDLPENVHFNRVRGNMWRYVDFNGDGKIDLAIGTDDWTDYGWDDAYNDVGEWQNGPLRGNIYIALNEGTNDSPRYAEPFRLQDRNGNDLETFGWPSPNFADWDGDGDLDIVVGEFRDTLHYFENVGTRTEPVYAELQPLTLEDGSPAAVDLAMITPVAFDWNKDGKLDLIVGDEDGRIALFENSGKIQNGKPLFLKPRYFRQEADSLKCGALATPSGIDWDGDGDWDIVCGNSAGYIVFYENLSGPGVENPTWAAPVFLTADDETIRIMAGPNGSIQGPCEPKWGYTTLTAADWNNDGKPDILLNSIWGKVVWFQNIGSRERPKLARPEPIEVEWNGEQPRLAWGWLRPNGDELLTQWRTTPVAFDWNRDGLVDLLMLDQEGYFAFFERFKADDGSLKLRSPRRIFVDQKGNPIRLNEKRAGGSGRRKICVVDYDGDGATDFLVNSSNATLYRQTKSENGLFYFEDCGPIDARSIQGHSSSPTVVDFNGDGVFDPFIGAEDGHFYYKRNVRP